MSKTRVKLNKAQLMYRINQIGERAAKGISTVMREETENIATLAKSYAPVDEGNLEAAIKTEFDYLGVNGRLRASVYIDTSLVVRSDGKTVGNYARVMHELLQPYGSGDFHLGPLSRAKAEAGNDVGGKFLERAAKARMEMLVRKAQRIAQRFV